MSVLQKVGQSSEQKLDEIKLPDSPKFVLISSRALKASEIAILQRHGSGIQNFEQRYASLAVADIFEQLKCTFLLFRLDEHEDKSFIQSHYGQLAPFNVVCVKSAMENYNEEWIDNLVNNVQAVVVKTLINDSVKDIDYFSWLKEFKRIPPPPSCLALLGRVVKAFLGSR